MNQNLCDKLNALPLDDRKRFCFELNKILNDRVYSNMEYGLTDEDYNNLPADKVVGVEEKLYQKMFNKKEKKN